MHIQIGELIASIKAVVQRDVNITETVQAVVEPSEAVRWTDRHRIASDNWSFCSKLCNLRDATQYGVDALLVQHFEIPMNAFQLSHWYTNRTSELKMKLGCNCVDL